MNEPQSADTRPERILIILDMPDVFFGADAGAEFSQGFKKVVRNALEAKGILEETPSFLQDVPGVACDGSHVATLGHYVVAQFCVTDHALGLSMVCAALEALGRLHQAQVAIEDSAAGVLRWFHPVGLAGSDTKHIAILKQFTAFLVKAAGGENGGRS